MQDIRATDYHTAGEPFRIVTEGVPDIPGTTVLERREHAQRDEQVDAVRRLLVNEPRGHADMYGGFVVPPDDEGAHFGVLFWHKDGYSTACGHGTIALGAWAVRSRLVDAASDGETDVVIDVPSGRVTATVSCVAGEVRGVSFRNVPAYVLGQGIAVNTSRGPVRADISYGGRFTSPSTLRSSGCRSTPSITVICWRSAAKSNGNSTGPNGPGIRANRGLTVSTAQFFSRISADGPTAHTSATSPSSPTVRSTGRRAAQAPPRGSRC